MRKVLQINITANWGSHGIIAEEIGKVAISRGWESYIAYGRRANPSESHLIRIGNMCDERWHGLETRLLDNHGMASRYATRKFIKQIAEVNPDIIHLHNIHGYYINYPILFKFLSELGKPIVWTLHDCWSMTGHCVHFESVGCDKWKVGCHDCQYHNTYPASFIKDNSSNNYQSKKYFFTLPENMTIVPVCHWLGELVKVSYLGKYPVRVIHNGINLNLFSPQIGRPAQEDKFTLLGVASNWNYDKGRAEFSELSKNENYRVIMVGVSDEIKKQLPPTIHCVKRTSNISELVDLYSKADVFVNPTRNDTYPTVNLEALACGTPVVTYRTGGSPESVDWKTGSVVERGDFYGLASAIESIRNKTFDERMAQRKACRERAEKLFDRNDCYEQYVKLYDETLMDGKR